MTSAGALPAFQAAYGFALTPDQLVTLSGGDTAATIAAAAQQTSGVNAAMVYGTDGGIEPAGLVVSTGDEVAEQAIGAAEAGASILWRDAARAKDVATAMKITAQDLLELKIIDAIISEPLGGAHRDVSAVMAETDRHLTKAMAALDGKDGDTLRRQRREKFLAIGRNL